MDLSATLRERHVRAMRSDRIKLIVLIAVLILVIVAMFELQRWGRTSPGQQNAPKGATGKR